MTETQNAAINAYADVEIDFRGLFMMIWRRRLLLAAMMIIGLSLAAVSLSFITPMYKARALLLIEGNSPTSAKALEQFQALVGTFSMDTSLIMSELEVLRSRTMARKVVERLNLMVDAEFNPRFRALEKKESKNEKEASFKSLAVFHSKLEDLPAQIFEQEMDIVVSNFLEGLRIRSIPGSYAIQVEYQSRYPKKAALITNAVLDVYIEQRLEQKFAETKKIADWLDKRLKTLRVQVRETEDQAERYKREHNLLQGTRTVVSAEQLSQLNSQLVQAKAQKAEAGARLSQVEELKKNPDLIETSYEIINSKMIQSLKVDQVRLEGRLSEILSRYGSKHPEVVKAKAELADLKNNIRLEMETLTKSVSNEVRLADARIKALEEGLREIGGQRLEDNKAMIRLRELEREAESNRLIYDTFLQTYKRSNEQEELQNAEAKIISYAVMPRSPFYPNKVVILSLGMFLSLFFGLALIILLESLEDTFRSANQLEQSMGYACYALIPSLEDIEEKEIARYVLKNPSSVVSEAVRTLRLVLNLHAKNEGRKAKVVTITSSFPGEGKTTLSTWLALLTAKSGEKVLLIDGDLRRPYIHRMLGVDNQYSLVEYLTGKAELDEVIKKDQKSGLHMIMGRSVPNSALDLVSSEKMEKLVEALRDIYDFIVIDSPASLAVSDSRVLATLADQTLYAVAWDATEQEVVASGVKQFSDVGYNSLSFVLTNVDVKRHVRYGYGDTVYYYDQYRETNAA